MTDITAFSWISIGVIAAVLFPIISAYIKRTFQPPAMTTSSPWSKKVAMLLLFSWITALIVLAIYRSQNPSAVMPWHVSFLLGFSWESIVEKFMKA